MMTTRTSDGSLVTRPMATQDQDPDGDLWFITNVDTHKVSEIENDPNICLGYYNNGTHEWVSVSGKASISQDRDKIKALYKPDWEIWFEDGGGTPDDPKLALIFVDVQTAHYMKSKFSSPRVLFELAKAKIAGGTPDLGREEHIE